MRYVYLVSCFFLMIGYSEGFAKSNLKQKKEKKVKITYKKQRRSRIHLQYRKKNEPTISKDAKKELQQLFFALDPKTKASAGMKATAYALRAYIGSRWGLRANKKARSRWRALYRPIMMWNPAKTYRLIHKKHLHPRFFGKLKGFHFYLTAPNKTAKYPNKLGSGGVEVKMSRIPRHYKRRPYRFELKSYAIIKTLEATGIDKVISSLFRLFTVEVLKTKILHQKGMKSYSTLQKHDRKIMYWLQTHLPRTTKMLAHFLTLSQIMQKTTKSNHFKLNMKLRWNIKNIVKDYPHIRRLIRDKKRKIYVKIEFLSRGKYPWLIWTYERHILTLTFKAILTPTGFMFFDQQGHVVKGPWRPSQELNQSWLTRATINFESSWISASIRKLIISWKVRKIKNGATLSIRLLKPPKLELKDGLIIRILARLFIPGGIKRLFKYFLYNLTYADNGKGLRWNWKITKRKHDSIVHFHFVMPIVPNAVFSSMLRMVSYFTKSSPKKRRKKKRVFKRKKYKRKVFKVLKKRKGRRYYRRRKKHYPPIWVRIYRALYKDLKSASL